MTNPALATDGYNGRTYGDTLSDCPLLKAHGWSGPFKAPSVTTVNKAADRTGGLDLWKRRPGAEYAMDSTDIWPTIEDAKVNLAKWEILVDRYATQAGWTGRGKDSVRMRALREYAAALEIGDKETCQTWQRKLAVDLIAEAPNRHAREKAKQGTSLHQVAQDIAEGRKPVSLLPEDEIVIRQVSDFFDTWQPEILFAERSVFSRTHGYAGTPDLFARIPALGAVAVADYKRQNKVMDEVAYQLAPYAEADYLIDGNGAQMRKPIPKVELGLVVHFPPDGSPAKVHEVDLTGAMDVFLHTLELHKVRNAKTLSAPIDPPAVIPGDPAKRAAIAGCIEILRGFYPKALDTLAANWPEGVPTLKQAADHTAPQLAAIQKALDAAEAAHQIPVGYADGSTSNPSMSNQETAAA